jgi:phage terminase large subunit-like protein
MSTDPRQSRAAKIDDAYQAALPVVRARSVALQGRSLAEDLAALPDAARERVLDALSPVDFAALRYCWPFWARPKQRPPSGGWRWWFQQGGRGSGKTKTAAEWIREGVDAGEDPVLLAGPTLDHIDLYMLGGQGQRDASTLFDIWPPSQRPIRVGKKLIRFYNGVTGYLGTGEDPEFKGPNLRRVWLDEPTKCRYLARFFYHIELALRADSVTPARGIITTNPPDPSDPENVEWLKRVSVRRDVYAVISTSDENKAHLDANLFTAMDEEIGGTPLEISERGGELREEKDGQLFFQRDIDDARWMNPEAPNLKQVMVCVDPAASDSKRADEVGIVAVGIDAGEELYVTDDRSGKMTPEEYGEASIALYLDLQRRFPDAQVSILVEDSKFGMHVKAVVRSALRDKRGSLAADAVKIDEVTARGDKPTRAHPVTVLYRKGRVHHVGHLPAIEREITGWRTGRKSPGRMDALVHGATKLARLDVDPEPDRSREFEGLEEAQAAIPPPAFAPSAEAWGHPTDPDAWERV